VSPEALLHHYDTGAMWPRPAVGSERDLATTYQQALAVRALRMARGEKPMGFKIGFTNRTIWPRYQVFAPIWGTGGNHPPRSEVLSPDLHIPPSN